MSVTATCSDNVISYELNHDITHLTSYILPMFMHTPASSLLGLLLLFIYYARRQHRLKNNTDMQSEQNTRANIQKAAQLKMTESLQNSSIEQT